MNSLHFITGAFAAQSIGLPKNGLVIELDWKEVVVLPNESLNVIVPPHDSIAEVPIRIKGSTVAPDGK